MFTRTLIPTRPVERKRTCGSHTLVRKARRYILFLVLCFWVLLLFGDLPYAVKIKNVAHQHCFRITSVMHKFSHSESRY